jgi:SAM-dependent methyltransferase
VNPRNPDEEIAELYTNKNVDRLIRLYEHIASPPLIAEYNNRLARLEKMLPARGRLLDLACAAGYFFEQAAKRGWEAHGIDVGEWTREAASRRGLTNLHVGRLIDLGFPDEHFDVVHAAQLFEHLTNPRDELAEIHRILRPGGVIYVDVPNYRTLPILLGKDDFVLNTPPQHINYFTSTTLRSLLQTAGFRDVQISTSGGLKWENLFGRGIHGELKAYDRDLAEGKPRQMPKVAPASNSFIARCKQAVTSMLVKPLLYDRCRFGILLVGTGRRPKRVS